MKKLIFMLFCLNTIGQNKQLDSLRLSLNQTANDSLKIVIRNQIGELATILRMSYWDSLRIDCEKLAKVTPVKSTLYSFYLNQQAAAINNVAYVYQQSGNTNQAIANFLKAYELMNLVDDKRAVSTILNNIGELYYSQADLSKALEYFYKSIKIGYEANEVGGLALTLNNIGYVLQIQGNIPKAIENYEKSLKLSKQNGDKRTASLTLANIGTNYETQGDHAKALEYTNESLKIRAELNDKRGMAECYSNIATVYRNETEFLYNKEKVDLAYDAYTKSLKLMEDLDYKNGIASVLSNIGLLYYNTRNIPLAVDYWKRSMKISEQIGNKPGVVTSLVSIGTVYFNEKDYNKALEYCSQALKIGREINYPASIKSALRLINKIYKRMGNWKDAEKGIVEVIDMDDKAMSISFPILSEKEKELYLNTFALDYDYYYSYALNQKDIKPIVSEIVYNNAIKNKGLLLRSSTGMRNAILNSKDSSLIEKYENWINHKKEIAKLYSAGKETAKLEDMANELEKGLMQTSELYNDFNKMKNVNCKDIQKSLKVNEAAIEFIHFRHEPSGDTAFTDVYCAVIVKPGIKEPKLIKLFMGVDLQKLLGKFNQNNEEYVNSIYGTSKEPKHDLYNLIWKPIEADLKGIKTVYISPSGLLHKVSFAAISKSSNNYLCDNYKIILQSSTSKVAIPESYNINEKAIVSVFGGIDYNSKDAPSDSNSYLTWNYLAGTLSEGEKIVSNLKKGSFELNYFSGKDATEERLKDFAPKSNVLHVATHGFFFSDPDERRKLDAEKDKKTDEIVSRGVEYGFGVWSFVMNKNPLMRSGLVFAGANKVWNLEESKEGEDGVLTAQEVANLNMRKTELVVLSACETGLGDIKGSEGVYGLQRAFKMAGAKFIIMSLWQVPDAETEEFMEIFYNNLTRTKDLKESFAITQRNMRKKYSPFYWAPFVLME